MKKLNYSQGAPSFSSKIFLEHILVMTYNDSPSQIMFCTKFQEIQMQKLFSPFQSHKNTKIKKMLKITQKPCGSRIRTNYFFEEQLLKKFLDKYKITPQEFGYYVQHLLKFSLK